jgi:adenylyl-sulfate kinase
MANPKDVVWHPHRITGIDRARLNGQRPFVVWFTGLSGSGKSTLAGALEERLFAAGHRCYLLDGDNIRHGLNRDLGFSDADRIENIRRVGELAKILVDAGLIVIAGFISPFARDRAMVRQLIEPGKFVEVYLDAPLTVCEQRDPKGLYRKARAGEIKHVTGIDSPYEIPLEADVVLDTSARDVPGCVDELLNFCRKVELIPA